MESLLKCFSLFDMAGTITQLFGAGKSECSVIMLWTYAFASVSLTLWSAYFMWLVVWSVSLHKVWDINLSRFLQPLKPGIYDSCSFLTYVVEWYLSNPWLNNIIFFKCFFFQALKCHFSCPLVNKEPYNANQGARNAVGIDILKKVSHSQRWNGNTKVKQYS